MDGDAECSLDESEFIEELLRSYFNDPGLVVNKVSCVLACAVGENFLSIIKRATVSGTSGQNGAAERGARLFESLVVNIGIELGNEKYT